MSTDPTLPIPEPRSGVHVRTPRRGGPDPQVWVDSDAGLVVVDTTDHTGRRTELLLQPDEATRLADVLLRHAKEGAY